MRLCRSFLSMVALTSSILSSELPTSVALSAPAKTIKKSKSKKAKKGSDEADGGGKTAGSTSDENNSGMSSSENSGSSKKELLGNVGLSPSPMLGMGATFGMIKSSGSGIEATLLSSSGKVDSVVSASVMHLGARYRKGFTKSLYAAGGAGMRMASGKWNVLNLTQDAEYAAGSSFNAITLDGAIGAQFKVGSILIGADGLGISFPLFKMGVKKTTPSEEDHDPEDAKTQQGKFDKAVGGIIITIAKVGVGIEF